MILKFKKFKLDERKSPKFLDDVADCYWFAHREGITNAIGNPHSDGFYKNHTVTLNLRWAL